MMILSVIFLAFLPSLTLSKPATAGQLPVSSRLTDLSDLIYGLEEMTYNIVSLRAVLSLATAFSCRSINYRAMLKLLPWLLLN